MKSEKEAENIFLHPAVKSELQNIFLSQKGNGKNTTVENFYENRGIFNICICIGLSYMNK